jgi:hypothetical protein
VQTPRTNAAQSLGKRYAIDAQSLRKCCAIAAQMLSKCCANAVLMLYRRCAIVGHTRFERYLISAQKFRDGLQIIAQTFCNCRRANCCVITAQMLFDSFQIVTQSLFNCCFFTANAM